jgi:hypothetical protein
MVYAGIVCCDPPDEIFWQTGAAFVETMSQRAILKDLVSTFIARWPAAVVLVGVVLTLAWIALLFGLPLYLLI